MNKILLIFILISFSGKAQYYKIDVQGNDTLVFTYSDAAKTQQLNKEQYSSEKDFEIRKIKSFGFGSNKGEKIKAINHNIDSQILILKEFKKKNLLDYNNYLNNKIKSNVDSITALKNKYTFDLITLNIYNINSSDIDVYFLNGTYYLRIATSYYELSKTKVPFVLKKVNQKSTIGQLDIQ